MEYNPVVTRGLWAVTYKGTTKQYRAVDAVEAKFKFAQALGVDFDAACNNMAVVEIAPTRRKLDVTV